MSNTTGTDLMKHIKTYQITLMFAYWKNRFVYYYCLTDAGIIGLWAAGFSLQNDLSGSVKPAPDNGITRIQVNDVHTQT